MPRPCFYLYRYQILPISREIQLDLSEGVTSLDQLIAEKNLRFGAALKEVHRFDTNRSEVTHQFLFMDGTSFLLRFAVGRFLDRETKDFKKESLETWPSFFVFVWNDPSKQIIAVEQRFDAFQHPETVVRLI